LLKKKCPRPGEGSSRRNASLGDFGSDLWPGTAENPGGGLEGGEGRVYRNKRFGKVFISLSRSEIEGKVIGALFPFDRPH